MRRRRAVDLQLFDIAHQHERIHVASRHAAGADHANDFGIFAAHAAYADAAVGADAHMLQHAVIDQGEGLAVAHAGEKDQAAIKPWPDAVSIVNTAAAMLAFVHDVGFHPDREIAPCGAALHRAPLIGQTGLRSGNLDIDPRSAHRLSGSEIRVRPFQHLDRVRHRENTRDILVVNDQSHAKTSVRSPLRGEN